MYCILLCIVVSTNINAQNSNRLNYPLNDIFPRHSDAGISLYTVVLFNWKFGFAIGGS